MNHKISSDQARLAPSTARRGYTLIEMLIVMTVIGILATIALPGRISNPAVSLKAAGRVLASDLRLASDLAVQYATDYTLTFDVARNEYRLTETGPGNPPPLSNPHNPSGPTGSYIVSPGQIDGTSGDSFGVRLLGVKLKTSGQSVTNIILGAEGGTSPARVQDTEIWLMQGPNWNAEYLRLTVTAATGQVWLDQPKTYPAP